jgi:hypothetical protein
MNKYFSKIVVIFLLITIFPVVGSFCLQGLIDSPLGVKVAQAQAADKCNDEAPMSTPTKTFLPCCVNDTHSGAPTVIQVGEVDNFVPLLFFNETLFLKNFSDPVIYHNPIISPPELLAVRVTVLRI